MARPALVTSRIARVCYHVSFGTLGRYGEEGR